MFNIKWHQMALCCRDWCISK